MLRENPGYEISGEGEFQTLCRIVGEFAEVGVRGLVLGFLAALSTSRQPGAFYTRRPVQKQPFIARLKKCRTRKLPSRP